MNKPRTTISSIINKCSRRDITDKLDEEFTTPQKHKKLVIQDQTLKKYLDRKMSHNYNGATN